MKSVRIVFFVSVVLFLCDCPASAGIINFRDGKTHNINYTINDWVYVDFMTPYTHTTVNVLDGGSISWDKSDSILALKIININSVKSQ